MIEVLITLIPSIIWLVYRCIKVLRAPTDDIIHDLNIDIPHIPNICIDSISSNSITIHWDIKINNDEQLNYIVIVNNQEAATLSSTNCQFNDLNPDTIYQFQIIAVNLINNFKSQSNPIFVETTSENESEIVLKEFNNNDDIVEDIEKFKTNLINHNISDDDISHKDISIDSISQITDEKSLDKLLKLSQYKLLLVFNEFRNQQVSIDEEIKKINKNYESLNSDLKDSNQVINLSLSNFKEKQKKKEDVMLIKNKFVDQLVELKRTYQTKLKRFEHLQDELNSLQKEKDKIELKKFNEKDEINNEINEIKLEISNIKQEIHKNEISLKNSKNNKKQINNYWEFLKKLVEPWQKEKVFNDDNSINNKGLDILNNIISNTTWSSEIQSDLNELNRLDNAWRNSFKVEIKNYVTNFRDLETLKCQRDKSYVPKIIDEYDASIEFGGESNKLFKKRKIRNRSKSQTLSSSSSSSPGPNQSMNNIQDFYGDIYNEDPQNQHQPPLISVQLGHSLSSPPPIQPLSQINPAQNQFAQSMLSTHSQNQYPTQYQTPLNQLNQNGQNLTQPQGVHVPNIYNNQELPLEFLPLNWNKNNLNIDRSFLNVYNQNSSSPSLQNTLATSTSINSNIWDANFNSHQSWNYNSSPNLNSPSLNSPSLQSPGLQSPNLQSAVLNSPNSGYNTMNGNFSDNNVGNTLNVNSVNNGFNHANASMNGINAKNLEYQSSVFDYFYKEENK